MADVVVGCQKRQSHRRDRRIGWLSRQAREKFLTWSIWAGDAAAIEWTRRDPAVEGAVHRDDTQRRHRCNVNADYPNG
jgi:hypothetical protein